MPLIFHIHRFSPVDPSQLLLSPLASSLWGSQFHLGLSFPFTSPFFPKIEPHHAHWCLTHLGTPAPQWQECPCQARCDRAAGTEQAGVWVLATLPALSGVAQDPLQGIGTQLISSDFKPSPKLESQKTLASVWLHFKTPAHSSQTRTGKPGPSSAHPPFRCLLLPSEALGSSGKLGRAPQHSHKGVGNITAKTSCPTCNCRLQPLGLIK